MAGRHNPGNRAPVASADPSSSPQSPRHPRRPYRLAGWSPARAAPAESAGGPLGGWGRGAAPTPPRTPPGRGGGAGRARKRKNSHGGNPPPRGGSHISKRPARAPPAARI